MAGGSGKRLWPLSRRGEPKQLLPLFDGKSLLQLAYERVRGVVAAENVLVCAGAAYSDVVAAQLPEVPAANILGEPEGRDSLNAVAWSARTSSGSAKTCPPGPGTQPLKQWRTPTCWWWWARPGWSIRRPA